MGRGAKSSKRFSKRSEDKAQRPGPDGVYPPTLSELWFKVDTVTLDKLSAEHTRGRHGISVADQNRLVEEMQTALLATDEEKRVVEIVTQMLVERGLNPKAPERIPVVEADPKHANQQREEVERRDQQENRAPKVRHNQVPRLAAALPARGCRAHLCVAQQAQEGSLGDRALAQPGVGRAAQGASAEVDQAAHSRARRSRRCGRACGGE